MSSRGIGGFFLLAATVYYYLLCGVCGHYTKYEYKYSVSGPVLLNDKKSGVDFFEHSGSVMLADHVLRLTPSMENLRGMLSSKYVYAESEWWEAVIDFKVFGTQRMGADGMAFWFTEQQSDLGPVFGGSDNWKGLGLFLDSFDNDDKGPNPQIIAVINNGSTSFNHEGDGDGQIAAGCQVDYRNTPNPSRLRVRYFMNFLTVWYSSGTNEYAGYPSRHPPKLDPKDDLNSYGLLCFHKGGVKLTSSKNGYFALSAMTGAVGDDHDIFSFAVYSIMVGAQPTAKNQEQALELEQELTTYDSIYEEAKNVVKSKKILKNSNKSEKKNEKSEDVYTQNLHLIYAVQQQMLQSFNQMKKELENSGLSDRLKFSLSRLLDTYESVSSQRFLTEVQHSIRMMDTLHNQVSHLQYNMDVLMGDHMDGLSYCITPAVLFGFIMTQTIIVSVVFYIFMKYRKYRILSHRKNY